MATSVTLNGNSYSIPAYNDTGYAQGSGNLSSYLVALATGVLSLAGGTFTLTADANFGGAFGLVALYLKSVSSNIATAGFLRMGNTDLVEWRNFANAGNNTLGVDSSDRLTYNGLIVSTDAAALTVKSFVYSDASGVIASTAAPTNGQILIGSTGAIPVVGSVAGTTNQITSTPGPGTIVLSTPQNIHTAATPTFASETLTAVTNQLTLGTTNTTTISATAPASSRTYTLPDMLGASKFLLSAVSLVDNAQVNAAGYIIGTVVQTQTGHSTTSFSTSSGTYQTTNLTVNITPKATTHKIRVTASGEILSPNVAACDIAASIFRGSTDTAPDSVGLAYLGDGGVASGFGVPACMVVLDSPATTSSTTYTVKIRVGAGSGTIVFGTHGQQYILVEEIAA